MRGCVGKVLLPGQAVFLPAGTVPLWIGLPSDVDLSQERPSLASRGKPAQQLYANYLTSKIFPTNVAAVSGFDGFLAAIKPPEKSVPSGSGQATV